jgi:hypothetical protein
MTSSCRISSTVSPRAVLTMTKMMVRRMSSDTQIATRDPDGETRMKRYLGSGTTMTMMMMTFNWE